MTVLTKRFPNKPETMQVFGMILFLVFGWSLKGFLYEIPAFILNQSVSSLIAILSYMMGFALLESLFVLAGLIALAVIFPQKWYREGFAYKGSATVLVAAFAVIRLQNFLTDQFPPRKVLYQGFAISVAVILILILLFQFIQPLRRIMMDILDRMQIFVYLYGALGILGIAIVTLRLIW